MTGSTSNNSPGFTSGGQLFGRDAAQWNIYIGTKVDQNNGYSVNQNLIDPIINGFPIPSSVVGAATLPLVVANGVVSLDNDSSLAVNGDNLGLAAIPNNTVLGNVSGSPAQSYALTAAQLAALISQPSLPTGGVMPFAAITAPSGWLSCNGGAVSRTTYAALFAVIGVTYGVGDGSTTFNVPDIRGRVVAGYDAGNATGRLTGNPAGGVAASVIGNAGGEEGHTLTTPGELPSHTHGVIDPDHSHGVADPSHNHSAPNSQSFITTDGTTGTQSGSGQFTNSEEHSVTNLSETGISINAAATGITIANTGSGSAHNTVQPTLILNYIIKT